MTPTHRQAPNLAADAGQTLTEYSLLVALIAVATAVAFPALASVVGGLFTAAAAQFG